MNRPLTYGGDRLGKLENYADTQIPEGVYFAVRVSLRSNNTDGYRTHAFTGMVTAAQGVISELPVMMCFYRPFEFIVVFEKDTNYCLRKTERILSEAVSITSSLSVVHCGNTRFEGDRWEAHIAVLPSWDEIVHYLASMQETGYESALNYYTDHILMTEHGLGPRQSATKRNNMKIEQKEKLMKETDMSPVISMCRGVILVRNRKGELSTHTELKSFYENSDIPRLAVREHTTRRATDRFNARRREKRRI